MELALIRHGQTDWNLAERVQGRTDVPLNATGREQARRAAQLLAAADEEWDLVVSSPLSRAHETAAIIAEALGVRLGDAHDGLIEQDFGEAEGTLVADLTTRWPSREFPGGELDGDVGVRGVRAITDLSDALEGARRVLAVSHGSFIRSTIANASGLAFQQVPRLENTSVSMLHRNPAWRVLTVGGTPFDEVAAAAAAMTARI